LTTATGALSKTGRHANESPSGAVHLMQANAEE